MFSRHPIDDRRIGAGAKAPRIKWLSFHLYLSTPIDLFLVRHFSPALERACASQYIRRFFFIRYVEPSLHLRLRFMLNKTAEHFVIEEWLEDTLREFVEASTVSVFYKLEQHEYDREKHYFGETMRSVYSELLNEQTSSLGLRLLRGYHDRQPQLTALLVACLTFFLSGMTDDRMDFIETVGRSRSFAANVLAQLGLTSNVPPKEQGAFDLLLPQICDRCNDFLSQDPAARAIIHLARRAHQYGDEGRFVVTHALHLFCNKLGFSIQDEHRVFSLLENSRGKADE